MKGKIKKIGDIIKSNSLIKRRLLNRFDDLSLLNKDIVRDAEERGYRIQESCLSRYLTKPPEVTGSLSQEQILWLCMRYCVNVKLVVRPYMELKNATDKGLPNGTLVPYEEKYDETAAINNLVKFFGYNPHPRKSTERPPIIIKGKRLGHGAERDKRIIDDLMKNPLSDKESK